jgi:glc operon protein GlcG
LLRVRCLRAFSPTHYPIGDLLYLLSGIRELTFQEFISEVSENNHTREEYMQRLSLMTAAACAAILLSAVARAQTPLAPLPPPPYGEPIALEQAKKIAAAAEAEAKKININDTIAIVEPNGKVVYFEKMDGTQYAGNLAIDKAVTAARLRRPTTASDLDKVGGLPIVIGGKLIGAIGVSGGSGPQDAQVAEAGLVATN